MDRIQFAEDDDLIDICYDNVFKAVFTRNTPASQGALSKLVSALIDQEVSVIEIITNEPPIESLHDRQIRFDINCKTGDGELINVEMSLNPTRYEPVRLEYHAGKLFSGQDIRGRTRSYKKLKPAYQIAILAKDRFFPNESFIHCFEYYDPGQAVSLKGRTRIITLELSKLDRLIEKPVSGMDTRELWAYYFKYLTDKEKRRKINEILEAEEGIAMASEVLMTISKDEIERARLMSELKWELDTESRIDDAREDGIEEGIKEGIKEGIEKGRRESQEKIARKALAEGASIEFIQKITDLTVEEIKKL